MTQMAQQTEDQVIQCVTFRLAEEIYGINVMLVQEVLRVTEIAPVPGAPHFILGIINLRGNVVTVIDTRSRLGLPARDMDDSTRILIIEINRNVVGMVVDSVAEVVDLNMSDVESPPNVGNDDNAKYIQGVVSREEYLLILMDLNKLLAGEEWMELAGM